MNILVTGGAGFIGSHLIPALLDIDDNVVICVDNNSMGTFKNISHFTEHPRFKFHSHDINKLGDIYDIFRRYHIDRVYHLAANSDISKGINDPLIDHENTYMTTFNILDCMRRCNVNELFFTSTSAVYGLYKRRPFSEDDRLLPISHYGAAKTNSETLIYALSDMYHFSSIILRLPNIVGSNMTHGAIYDFINKLSRNRNELTILGDGTQEKVYMHISDLIRCIIYLYRKLSPGSTIYNIGTNGSTTVERIVDFIQNSESFSNTIFKRKYTGGIVGWPGDVPKFEFNLSKIHGTYWKAQYSSDEAVNKAVNEVCSQLL